MSDLEYVISRLGNVKSETRSIAIELFNAAKKAGHDVWFIWGMGTSAEHKTGLALDLMVRNEAGGDFVRNYIWTHRKRLRLVHVIWEQHITSTVVEPGVRRKMADRGNPTANHYDHVHVWLFTGAYQAPSAPAPKPPASTTPVLKEGSTGGEVRKVQDFFRRVFPSYRHHVSVKRGAVISVDGHFGKQTEAWVIEFQERTSLKKDGEVGPATMAKLRKYGYR